MSTKEYFLGLDMGVTSVGWAVTDKNYNLLRKKGKDLWGIREFDEAETSQQRRTHRISRRRRQREVVRLGLLKDYFHDEICKVDPEFYLRLDNSKYYVEDKDEKVKYKNAIFNDENYQDADCYRDYPTIFHLRKQLLHQEEPVDVRLLYLALANMFKHRGHFLNAGLSDEGEQRTFEESFLELNFTLQEKLGFSFQIDEHIGSMEEILIERDLSRTKKVDKLKELLHIETKEKQKVEFIKTICGLKVAAKKLFPDLEEEQKIEICFADYDFDEKVPELMEAIGEEYFEIIEMMKEGYDIASVSKIMKGFQYLSDARVAEYEKHKADLKCLKELVKIYNTNEEYDYLFRSAEAGTYSAYVNSVNTENKSRRNMKGRQNEDLYKTIKKYLKEMPQDDEKVIYVTSELEKESFLPKQLTASNGVIPNQIHTREMKKILENAEKQFPFLRKKDESGYTVSERIVKLFTFQIPYYIGPTSINSKTGWVVRKEDGVVLPWNLETKVDVKETSEKFISRMVRRCSYLNEEMVLPKASLEYESFCVLNEINNISIDGERISVQLKQDIYNVLFKRGKKVTKKQIVSFLMAQGVLKEASQLTGIDISVNSSLSTYGKFKAIFGEQMEEDNVKRMVEKIVFWGTIYGDSKKFLSEKIAEAYGEQLTLEQIKRITGYKFKDWGKLSKEFLELPGCDTSIGENVSLIRMMWETNLNLMELIKSPQYTYVTELCERQNKTVKVLCELQPEDLDGYYFSAPVKRMVWQTILLTKELEQIMGGLPERIFIEMTRKPDDKKERTISRKQKFLELYKNIKSETRDWKSEIEKADADGTLRSKKMYLYLTQMGHCMYTGEEIRLNDLFNDNLYDIDHVYPRHYVKDDNINNNLVLVKKESNNHKSDTYPLETTIYEDQKNRWKYLLEKGLITEEKYKRLTGRNPFTEEQKADFIARQLVETSQGTKSIADLLKKVLPETTIVYSKASNVSEFRQSRKLYKCRSVNDFHHAHDAYLNIVVGNVYFTKFTLDPLNFIKNDYGDDKKKYHYHLSRMFDWDVTRNGEIAWIGAKDGEAGTIVTVKKMLKKNTPLMTRRNFVGHGAIAKETLYGKQKASPSNYIPLKAENEKMADVNKYGGFTSVSTAYFFLVEHTEKKKRVRTLETVPIYLADKIQNDQEGLLKYCKDGLGLVEPRVCLKKIKLQSLIKKDGYLMHISGKTGDQVTVRNAVNLCLKKEWVNYVKLLEKFIRTGNLSDNILSDKNIELYEEFIEKFNHGIYSKRPNPMGEKLEKKREDFVKLKIEEQCKVLSEILKLTTIGVNVANLELIGEGKHTGVMKIPKKVDGAGEFLLIHQSVTGVYEKTIDLLKL